MTASKRELALAAASGLLLGAAFLPAPLGWLAWFALVPMLAALESRLARGATGWALFRLGYAGGFAFFLVGLHWLALLTDVASTVPWLKYAGWLAGSAYMALFWAVAVGFAGVLARRSGWPARWTFAIAMLLVEELRGSGELGFPWFQPGYTQHALPALALASLGGVTLVTAWLLALNGAVRDAMARRTRGAIALALALAALPWAWPPAYPWSRAGEVAGGPRVALVQANIPGEIKWSGDHQMEILQRFLALSDSALARPGGRPALVVWPETATGSYLRKQVPQTIAVAHWAAAHGVQLFSGFADYAFRPDGRPVTWNAAGAWNPDGSLTPVYAKRRLVPFGERIPFQWLVPALGRLDLGQAEWEPGRQGVVFRGAAGAYSCLVCFESIFPDLARADVRAGSRMLVIVTNDEWFGNGAALWQHAAMAPFRAVENGVPLVRCANTGVTEVIAPNGRIVARAPVFVPAVLETNVPPGKGGTLFGRFGDWPLYLALLSGLLSWLAPWRWGRSRS